MSVTIDEIYDRMIRILPSSERLRLANLILTNLVQQDMAIDDGDTWTDEDIADLSRFSLQYASIVYPDDEELI